jgi:hypothetical protein
MEWSTVWVSTKPLITEENWLGRGLNLGHPNDTPALYPLLHELMLPSVPSVTFLCMKLFLLRHVPIKVMPHNPNTFILERFVLLINFNQI